VQNPSESRVPACASSCSPPGHARVALAVLFCLFFPVIAGAADAPAKKPTMQQVIDASKPSDWRSPAPADTLYMELPGGRVVIELAVAFAPLHAANIRTLVRQKYFDGLAVLRVQDNFVTQWGDPNGEDASKAHPFGEARQSLPAEFSRASAGLEFTPLADGDVYAPEVGFSNGFPAARDPKPARFACALLRYGRCRTQQRTGIGSGAELYVVMVTRRASSIATSPRSDAYHGHGIDRITPQPQ
jgi:peptidylprolyl isomerase